MMGSLAFITTARAAWIISRDPQDPERRLMLPMKNNLAASATGLAYTVESSGAASAPIVRWSADPIAISVDMAIGRPAKQMGRPDEERQKAIDWLRQTLAGKGLPSKDIIERAEELGFCERTVRRAFRDSGGEAIREGFGILGVWFWKLPPPMAKNASMAKSP
jgi:putative DNA primase/helicase